jgi:hypothetical protein
MIKPGYFAALAIMLPSLASAQVQIAEPVTIEMTVTVQNMAAYGDAEAFEAMGCELNEQTNIVEC